MKEFLLEIAYIILGVGAASGLFYKDRQLYIISDNSNYLYRYSTHDQKLYKTLLIEKRPYENLSKEEKSDFEAIFSENDMLVILGSGSDTSYRRNQQISIPIGSKRPAAIDDIRSVYQSLQKKYQIDHQNFNIEGAIPYREQLLLFNRGNGPLGFNGVFRLTPGLDTVFIPVPLPALNETPAGFSDAVKVRDTIYFTAIAESQPSVYHDGEIKGTYLGIMRLPEFEVEQLIVLSDTSKFEGITLFSEDSEAVHFLLCEDRDSHSQETVIYQLKIKKTRP